MPDGDENSSAVGTAPFVSTAKAARRLELMAARGNAYEAKIRKTDLALSVEDMLRALRELHAAKVDRAYLDDTIAGLIDAAANADHACNRDIDNAGEYFTTLDLSEAHALLAKVRS